MLTQKKVLELFIYEPTTGIVTRKIQTSNVTKKGEIVGSKNNGYLDVQIQGKKYRLHRIIWLMMTGNFPNKIDHKDRKRDNNKWNNLRDYTHKQNNKNRGMSTLNTSGINGIAWVEGKTKWKAFIGINGKTKHIGYYNTKNDAISARKEKEKELDYDTSHGLA